MSKRLAITLLSVGIAALTGVLIWAIAGRGSFFGVSWAGIGWARGPERSVKSYDAEASDIESVIANFSAEDVRVMKGTGNVIHVEQFAIADLPDEYIMNVRQEGKRLILQSGDYNRPVIFLGSIPCGRIEIHLPQRLADTLSVSTASGEISVESVAAKSANAASASGDVAVMNIDAQSIDCGSTSGDITVTARKCESLTAAATSGTINIEAEVEKNMDLSTISGDIFINGSAQSAEMSSTSGDITCEFSRIGSIEADSTSGTIDCSVSSAAQLQSVHADTISGDVRIGVPAGTAVSTDYTSVSGDMRTNTSGGAIEVRDNGIPIVVGTTSGDFLLETLS